MFSFIIHIYMNENIFRYKLKELKCSVSKHNNENNNLDHSVDNNGILTQTKPENHSNLTDCSTVHGVLSSHHVHTHARIHTHSVLNRQ